MTNPTLLQRLFADTPDFFKKVHLLGLALIAVATTGSLPANWAIAVGAVGATMAAISQLAVKDAALLSPGTTAEQVLQAIPEVMGQIKEVKDAAAPLFDAPPATAVVKEVPGVQAGV